MEADEDRGIVDSEGGRLTASGRSGVGFADISTIWDESGQAFYVTDDSQL